MYKITSFTVEGHSWGILGIDLAPIVGLGDNKLRWGKWVRNQESGILFSAEKIYPGFQA
jgi:hypothetical protein